MYVYYKQNKTKTPKSNESSLSLEAWNEHACQRTHNFVRTHAGNDANQLKTSHCLRMLPRLPDLTPTRPSLTMASAKAL